MTSSDVPRRQRLGSRLSDSRDFARLKAHGRRTTQGCLICNWDASSSPAAPRLGVVTSRRVGGAVQRTRARRLLREAYRLHRHQLAPPIDVILVARPSIRCLSLRDVERDFLRVIQKAGLSPGTAP